MAPPPRLPAIATRSFFAEVTRWKMSCCGMEPMARVRKAVRKSEPLLVPALGPEVELVAVHRRADHLGGAARHVAHDPGDEAETDEDHHRLEKIRHRHRPHAAPDRIGEHDDAA